MNKKMLAAGSRDEYGETLKEKQEIEQTIINVLNDQGYIPVSTPLIEQENVFDQYQEKKVFHLLDHMGEKLVLRPDLTLPIARFLAANQTTSTVTRLYYLGDVFHQIVNLSGDYNQETQAGIEIISEQSFEAEIEALETMLAFAQRFGIVDVQVVLSDARLIDLILGQFDLDDRIRIEMKQAIEEKNISRFEQLKAQIPDFPAELANWPLAFGENGESAMEKLRRIPAVKEIMDDWVRLADYTHLHYPDVAVTVDLAAVSPQPYYTGTIVRGFVPSLGDYLFSGGRYDRLLSKADQETVPAMGMALKVETVLADRQRDLSSLSAQDPIVVVLAKGRVEQDVRPLLKKAGVDTSQLDNPARKLVFDTADNRYRFILVKANDVVKYLDQGIGDVGIVGSDTIAEQEQNHYDVLDLQTGKAEFVLAACEDFEPEKISRLRIATKYPKLASQYFHDQGEDVELIKLEGSVELGPITGLADGIIDITQTGRTLVENHLQIFDRVGPVATHFLVRKGSLLQYQDELTTVIKRLANLVAPKEEVKE
ncbi:ATP phosphoribosyltransferase [Fructobacillus cardui]|uniref:Multifunctional fusion protein n=1 Tax=Fructobacillus cardui TaxID=2893170 RepID=A0ABN9YZX0_9LACO|nr:ATP phosphoribosyltransferase regulatory subunit HisZ (HisZ) [Fructobacillus cardui]CAK1252411.1 ATP phosphoribosyltransferase regulatory subunit HisZ (HisZ) [Fructobacillus cardui]